MHEVLEVALTVLPIDDVFPTALSIAPLRDVVTVALKVVPFQSVACALVSASVPLHEVLDVVIIAAAAMDNVLPASIAVALLRDVE
jgi:hypothetical protein